MEIYWISGSPFAWRVLLTLKFRREGEKRTTSGCYPTRKRLVRAIDRMGELIEAIPPRVVGMPPLRCLDGKSLSRPARRL